MGGAKVTLTTAARTAKIGTFIRFQGQYLDVETGLHYNRYRYYDPAVGRYVSKDPVGPAGGVNEYTYALNAIYWIDPLGLSGRKEPKPWIAPGNSKEGWQHIDERHIIGTNSIRGKGDLFEPGTTKMQVLKACECLVKKGVRLSDRTRSIQVYEKRIKVNGKNDNVRGIFDSAGGNRTITIFPARNK